MLERNGCPGNSPAFGDTGPPAPKELSACLGAHNDVDRVIPMIRGLERLYWDKGTNR